MKKIMFLLIHQRQLLFPVGENYFSPLPLVNEGREGE